MCNRVKSVKFNLHIAFTISVSRIMCEYTIIITIILVISYGDDVFRFCVRACSLVGAATHATCRQLRSIWNQKPENGRFAFWQCTVILHHDFHTGIVWSLDRLTILNFNICASSSAGFF